jgi:DNA invertase Pin-like site-specific DNA recombinase
LLPHAHTVQAGPLDLSSPSGRMVAQQLVRWPSMSLSHRSERVRAASLQRAQQGRRADGPRPFGYEDDGVTVREPEAATGLTTSMKAREWDAHAVRA